MWLLSGYCCDWVALLAHKVYLVGCGSNCFNRGREEKKKKQPLKCLQVRVNGHFGEASKASYVSCMCAVALHNEGSEV